MKAMIFAAGLGTRLKPWTDHHPKALAMVNGKSLLQRNVQYLQQHGIWEVIVNVHHFAQQIIDTIAINNGWGSNITISDETDVVLETGGGLQKAAWYFANSPHFVVLNADMLTNLNLTIMLQLHQLQQPLATLAVTERVSSRQLLFYPDGNLCGWRNTQTNEQKGPIIALPKVTEVVAKAFSGIHIISNNIFPKILQQGKFGMIDLYLNLAAQNYIRFFDHSGDILIDVGKPENLVRAQALFV